MSPFLISELIKHNLFHILYIILLIDGLRNHLVFISEIRSPYWLLKARRPDLIQTRPDSAGSPGHLGIG